MEFDLQALPEGCIANVISLTSHPDAVWSKFLPPAIPTQGVVPHSLRQSSAYRRGKKSFSIDKWSGKKCYMIAARDLLIVWADTLNYWRWISVSDSRFEEVAELLSVCWLDIRGKINIQLLSPSTMYKSYLVFKSTAAAYGFELPAEVTVGLVGGAEPTKKPVFLDTDRSRAHNFQLVPRHVGIFHGRRVFERLQVSQLRDVNDNQYPKERAYGWLEIELGEFFCDGREDGELEMTCLETKGGHWKGGLLVQGIEVSHRGSPNFSRSHQIEGFDSFFGVDNFAIQGKWKGMITYTL